MRWDKEWKSRKEKETWQKGRKVFGRKRIKIAGILWGVLLMACLDSGITCQANQFIPEIRSSFTNQNTRKIMNTLGITEDNEEDIDLQDLGDSDEDISDEEIEQILDAYLKQIEQEEPNAEFMNTSKITDPVMEMKPEGDGSFRYTLPNGNYFLSSVPNGMIHSEAVDLFLPDGTMGLVQKDDTSLAFPDSWHFTQKGNYHVQLLILQPPGNVNIDYNVYEVNFYFTIIDKKDNTLGAVFSPEGFHIIGVRLDGKQQEIEQQQCFFLKGDGYYEFQFESLEYEGVCINTAFTRDTKAPFLSFSEELKPEGISGSVEFYPSEQNCQVYMNYNGSRGYAVSNILTAAGSYELSVEDSTGNRRAYYVRIRQIYHLVDKRVIVAAGILLIAAVLRLMFLRKNMRVL